MENFYPSISEELLEKAINYAMQFDDISQKEREIIFQSKKSSLHSKDQAWTKKGDTPFDVTMGSFDGAETCELVGLYLLSLLQDLGVDRNHGLGACRKTRSRWRRSRSIYRRSSEIMACTSSSPSTLLPWSSWTSPWT